MLKCIAYIVYIIDKQFINTENVNYVYGLQLCYKIKEIVNLNILNQFLS